MATPSYVKIDSIVNSQSQDIAASLKAVKDAYDKAQNAICDLTISGTTITYKKNNGESATIPSFQVMTIGSISDLSSKTDGYYSIASATLSGVSGAWMITKIISTIGTNKMPLYTATNLEDPRVVLNSVDLSNWYSPYAYWHA